MPSLMRHPPANPPTHPFALAAHPLQLRRLRALARGLCAVEIGGQQNRGLAPRRLHAPALQGWRRAAGAGGMQGGEPGATGAGAWVQGAWPVVCHYLLPSEPWHLLHCLHSQPPNCTFYPPTHPPIHPFRSWRLRTAAACGGCASPWTTGAQCWPSAPPQGGCSSTTHTRCRCGAELGCSLL